MALNVKKGRNTDLIALRDAALLKRWYYWTEVQRLRFDDALKQLSHNEFFISEERILAILRKRSNDAGHTEVRTISKARPPRISAGQLSLFTDDL